VSRSNDLNTAISTEAKRWRWDWILLPALGLLTVCILAGSTELVALWIFPEKGNWKNCVVNSPSGPQGVPNSVCPYKMAEGQWMELKFNSCGDYTEVECTSKPPGAFRIVMIGTSFAMGDGVRREQTFAALLPKELSRLTGREIQLYNESLPRISAHDWALRFNQVTAAKPDMVLWVFNYADVRIASITEPSQDVPDGPPKPFPGQSVGGQDAPPVSSALARLRGQVSSAASSFVHKINDVWRDTHSFVLLTHLIGVTESQSQFLARNRTGEAQYLNATPSQARLRHLKDLDGYARDVLDRARAAGVPVVAVFLPTRIQVAMISNGKWQPDLDPYELDNELRTIIVSHGGTYIDILPDIRTVPAPERGFFPADGHPNPEGHLMISNLLARELTDGAVSALRVNRTQAALERR
jgi:hypothetical protein